ncbi:MAG: Gfo/Idh/MocA family oxidoreductase [Dehalococcoidia bacterium]
MTASGAAPLRVGVLGVGFGSVVHIPAFRSEGWDVAAIWSRRPDRTREAAATHGLDAATVAEDWREVVARDDLDAIAVATPPVAHLEMTLAALAAGKHVLCEKPVRPRSGTGDRDARPRAEGHASSEWWRTSSGTRPSARRSRRCSTRARSDGRSS